LSSGLPRRILRDATDAGSPATAEIGWNKQMPKGIT
jgi:hypothetical protein